MYIFSSRTRDMCVCACTYSIHIPSWFFRFLLVNVAIVYIYSSSFQKVDEEEYGGIGEILKEGLMTSFSSFMVLICYPSILCASFWFYALAYKKGWVHNTFINLKFQVYSHSKTVRYNFGGFFVVVFVWSKYQANLHE